MISSMKVQDVEGGGGQSQTCLGTQHVWCMGSKDCYVIAKDRSITCRTLTGKNSAHKVQHVRARAQNNVDASRCGRFIRTIHR